MKKELFLVLKSSNKAYATLLKIKSAGYNATVVSTESLRHAVDYVPNDHHFFNLRHLEKEEMFESILCIFVVDEDKLEPLKEVVRQETDNFNNIKGFMYSRDIDDYEGSI